MARLVDFVLSVARALGLFALSRRLTRDRLRILGYHGVALRDEAGFRPVLFMRAETFGERLETLMRGGFPVLPLGDAIERLRIGTLPHCAVVITIDDGWYGTYRHMAPELARRDLPATLYLSTYYLEKQTQNFHVASAYALWKTLAAALDLSQVDSRLTGRLDLKSDAARAAAARNLIAHAESLVTAEERQALLERLYEALGIDIGPLRRDRVFGFMSAEEASALPAMGIDLQLHTHRHRFPAADDSALAREIGDNRAALGRIAPGPFRHLCYPSGEYDRAAFPRLTSLGIESATTTRPGMNGRDASPLELRRFLDSEDWSPIRFEAELSGFLELARQWTGRGHDWT